MTRTALRRGPVPPLTRTGLHLLDDGELLDLVRSEPIGSAVRSDACEVLVMRYEALVRSCVLRYCDTPESAEELMQVGYVGLLKAINNFDPAFGGSLAAYAQPCISGEVKRHFRDKRWQVRVKRSAQELLLEVRQASEDLAQQLGRAPADTELARHLGVSDADLLDARRADLFFHTPSLDAPVPRTEGMARLADLLGEEDPPAGAGGGHGRGQRALDRTRRPAAPHPADAVLRQHDAGRDRRPAGHLPDARLPAPGRRTQLPAGPAARAGASSPADPAKRLNFNADKETGMKTATGLALIAVGAILAFAVNAHPQALNIQVVGWVLILIGLVGMFIPRRGYGWLRKRMVVRPRQTVVAGRRGLAASTPPGTVVMTTEEVDDVPAAGVDPALLPGRQISKAEADELGLITAETIDEFRQE